MKQLENRNQKLDETKKLIANCYLLVTETDIKEVF